MVKKVDIVYCIVCIVCKLNIYLDLFVSIMYMNMYIVKINDYTICIQVQIDIYKLVVLNVSVHLVS